MASYLDHLRFFSYLSTYRLSLFLTDQACFSEGIDYFTICFTIGAMHQRITHFHLSILLLTFKTVNVVTAGPILIVKL